MKTYIIKLYHNHIEIGRHIDGSVSRYIPIYDKAAINRFLAANKLRELYTEHGVAVYELRKG